MVGNFDKEAALRAAKAWFRNIIIKRHFKNTKKLTNLDEFKINPFLIRYLACFLTGKCDPTSIAKALIYPRVLGVSISTSFGQNLQKFISTVLGSPGSLISGIDIEFIDRVDMRKKYCQLKLGPDNINHDSAENIKRKFSSAKNIARTNNLRIEYNDLIVGVLYGEKEELSEHFKKLDIDFNHPVYIGKEFWTRLTGSGDFYKELISAINEVAKEHDGSHLLQETISKLAESAEVKAMAD